MKTLKSPLALVLILAMVLCAVVPTYAAVLPNAADEQASFDYVAFEMETVNSSDETTMFYGKGESVTLNIVLFGIKGGTASGSCSSDTLSVQRILDITSREDALDTSPGSLAVSNDVTFLIYIYPLVEKF